MNRKLIIQKNWVDNFFNWEMRANEWTGMLQGVLQLREQNAKSE